MIAINAAIVDQRPSGLGVVAREISGGLSRLRKDVVILEAPSWVGAGPGFLSGGLARFLWAQTALPTRLRKLRAQVLLSPNHEAVLFPPCPQVVVIHDLLPLLFPDNYPRQRFFYRNVLPWILKNAAAVVSVSENTKQDLIVHYRLPPEKINVIYSGVDHARFNAESRYPQAPKPYILFVGNQYPYKNIAGLIEAFSGLTREFPHQLLIAGAKNPAYFPELRGLVSRLGLEERVRFLGYVSQEELPRLYTCAQLLVLPSFYEGFGLPVLEAMACGCPAAVSNCSSLPEAGGRACAYFDPTDVSDMRLKIAEVLGSAGRRQNMAALGVEHAARFTWEKAAAGYAALLDSI